MTAATKKKPDAFGALVAALQAAYEDEIHRLVEIYRSRILAGEFSGVTVPPNDKARWWALQEEISKRHPWARRGEFARAVLAVSPWAVDRRSTLGHGLEIVLEGPELSVEAGECMARDVMRLAIERGWLKRGSRENGEPEPVLRAA